MTDMELVIKIPEDVYKNIIENGFIYDEDNEIVTYVIKNGTPLPKGHKRLIDADKVKKDIIDWFMYTVNGEHKSIPKDCDELIKYITGWVTYAIDKTSTIIEADTDK